MRDIKQLGIGAVCVFPGATHTRFEHCLGTAHLAGQMVLSLRAKQGLEIRERDVENVILAALVHDIGHAANSHAFEYGVIKGLKYPAGTNEIVQR